MGVASARGRQRLPRAAAACLLGLWLAACAAGPEGGRVQTLRAHEDLDAVLWLQSSAEYRANALQAFAAARVELDRALADPAWTAALEQTGDFLGLPPAIVLDMDESIVRSDRFQAWLAESEQPFRIEDWNAWVRSRDAPAVPGAVEYVRYAHGRGVRIFYVTNRLAEVETESLATLRAAGFPVDGGGGDVLSQEERPDWGADKSSRRAFLCRSHRLVQIVGDNLNDFLGDSDLAPPGREALVERYAAFWGSRWIVLPNPSYGSWEDAIHDYDRSLPRREILRRKYERLQDWR